jgi:hypothetical protein
MKRGPTSPFYNLFANIAKKQAQKKAVQQETVVHVP